jgi:hypothetical protein
MFPRRFPGFGFGRARAAVRPTLVPWVVRDIRTGRFWRDPYGLGPGVGDPRREWGARRRAYVFLSERVARTAIRAAGIEHRAAPFPAGDYAQHVGGRIRPEVATGDGGEPP